MFNKPIKLKYYLATVIFLISVFSVTISYVASQSSSPVTLDKDSPIVLRMLNIHESLWSVTNQTSTIDWSVLNLTGKGISSNAKAVYLQLYLKAWVVGKDAYSIGCALMVSRNYITYGFSVKYLFIDKWAHNGTTLYSYVIVPLWGNWRIDYSLGMGASTAWKVSASIVLVGYWE